MTDSRNLKDPFARGGLLQLGKFSIPRAALAVFFVACLLITLAAGLWPFSVPNNDAAWVPGGGAIRFKLRGTALSEGKLDIFDSGTGSCSLEVWLKPAMIWTAGTPLAFYDVRSNRRFVIEQVYEDLLLQLADPYRPELEMRSLRVNNVFFKKEFLLAITSDGRKTSVYVDGRLVTESPNFPLSGKDLSGMLILGNAPLRNHSWAGLIKGLAIYAAELNAQQVQEHEREWRQGGEPVHSNAEKLRNLYLFREQSGDVIHDAVAPEMNLGIPKKFVTVDELHFESPRLEMRADRHYGENAFVNVVGFMPLGFAAALFFASFYGARRAVVPATLVGAATSLTIEYCQAYLPTRYSGVTDLITNPLGTLIGASLCVAVAWFVKKKVGVELPPNPM